MNLPTLPALGTLVKFDFSRIQTVFAPAGAVVVSFLVLVLVIWPKFGKALATRTENKQLETRILLLSDKVAVLESLDKNVLDAQLVAAERLLPSDKAVFSFVRQVEAAASASGVVLTKVDAAPGAVSPGGTTAQTGASQTGVQSTAPAGGEVGEVAPKIQVKTALTGDYKSLVNFIKKIADLARVSSIRDLTIASTSSEGAAPLRSTMVVDAFFRVLPKELGSIESSVEPLSQLELEILTRIMQIAVSEPSASLPVVPVSEGGRSDLFTPF